MPDLSNRLRELADAMENGPYVSLKTIRDAFREAADALDQLAWRPIAEAPTPGGDFRVNYSPGFGAYVSLGDGHHFQDVKATHFMPLPQPPEGE